MAKRKIKQGRAKNSSSTVSSASPTRFTVVVFLGTLNDAIIDFPKLTQAQASIEFPCTHAECAYQLAQCALSLSEELAAKAGVKFLPAKELWP